MTAPRGWRGQRRRSRPGPGRRTRSPSNPPRRRSNKDQSSLTALDIHGLVKLDSVYTLLMSVACVAIFVFGLMLQRRREYVTLRAEGMRGPAARRARAWASPALVAGGGLVAGALVGFGMAHLFVHILRPLFVLDPQVTVDLAGLALLLLLPILATGVSTLVAMVMLGRMRPSELLRET